MKRELFPDKPINPVITHVPDHVARFVRRLDREGSPDIVDLILLGMWVDGWPHGRLAEITYAAPSAMLARIRRACEHVAEPLYVAEVPTPSRPRHPSLSRQEINEITNLQAQAQQARRQTRHDHPARKARRHLSHLHAHHLSRGIDLETLAQTGGVTPQAIWKRLPLGYRQLLASEPHTNGAL